MADGASDSVLIDNVPELQQLKSRDEQMAALNDLRTAVIELMQLARRLRQGRTREGALELEGVEVRVQLGDNRSIDDLIPKQVRLKLSVHNVGRMTVFFLKPLNYNNYCSIFKKVQEKSKRAVYMHGMFSGLFNTYLKCSTTATIFLSTS